MTLLTNIFERLAPKGHEWGNGNGQLVLGHTHKLRFPRMGEEQRRAYLDQRLAHFVGNEDVIALVKPILFEALGDEQHVCRSRLGFYGPSGCGKTELVRSCARVLEVPFCDISPKSVKTPHQLAMAMANTCRDFRVGNRTMRVFSDPHDYQKFIMPPMWVLLDEAHALADTVEQALLKPTEPKDGILVTEKGMKVDCRNVCWCLATTDRGELFDAIDTRFEELMMRLYTKDEIARIVKINHPEWDEALCQLIAHYCSRVPREALEFAEAVRKNRAYQPGSWEEVARRVASLKGIDEYGMKRQRLEILKALGQRPMSINGLCVVAGVKEKELRKYVLPWLLESTPDQPARVVVTNRHYISPEGLAELDKRGIEHRGSDALAPMDRD